MIRKAIACVLALLLMAAAAGPAVPVKAEGSPFTVYLSSSAQPWNPYADGSGGEEFWMRLVALCMQDEFEAAGIRCVVAEKRPEGSTEVTNFLTARAQEAEREGADLYLALHSNASPEGMSRRGTEIYVPTGDAQSQRFAGCIRDNFCYPDKSLISFQHNDSLLEMRTPSMPHVLIEVAYHDREDETQWIEENIQQMAHSLVNAILAYAGRPIVAQWKAPEPIVLSANALTLSGSGTAIITAAAPAGAVWSSGHDDVVSVSSCGVVTARQPGTATVAVCADGRIGYCQVTVQGSGTV